MTAFARGKASVLKGLGCLLFFAAFFGLGAVVSSKSGLFVGSLGFALAAAVFAVGLRLHNLGRRYQITPAARLLAEDTRPPVLYLRSFIDDTSAARTIDASFLPAVSTREEQLAAALSDLGPVVAIGAPGERLPELGAARFYFEGHEWQNAVLDFMNKSRLVVLRVGQTDAFWWEVENGLEMLPPSRLAFLIPLSNEHYHTFRNRLQRFHHTRLPDDLPGGGYSVIQGIADLWGILYFEDDWTPRLIPLERLPISMAAKYLLRPVEGSLRTALKDVFAKVA